MGVRQYRQNRQVNNFRDSGDKVYARNDQLAITSRPIGQYLAKQQAKMNRNALQVDVRSFYYFRRRTSGRLCSCMLGDENTPHSTCLICFNTGYTGGYDKYGTATEVVDTTHPSLILTNVHANYEDATRPVFFKLDEDAKVGTVQATINIRKSNNNYVDVLQVYSNVATLGADSGAVVDTLCREHGTNTWLPFTFDNMQAIFNTASAAQVDLVVYMKRKSTRAPSPVLSHIYIRYGLLPQDQCIINADIPRNTESITMLEYGFEEQFGSITLFTDNTIQTYSIDDYVFYLNKKKFWKLTEVQPFYSMGMHVSFDLTARYMQQFEMATQVPV